MNFAEPTILLRSYRQARKVRVLFWLFAVIGALALWGGWWIFETYGLSEADGGVLRPLWERLALGGFVAGLGLAAALGMWVYISVYALEISRAGERIGITTMTPFGEREREFPMSEIGKSAYYHGRVRHTLPSGGIGALWVDAPWITIRVRGHRLPFVADLQAEVIDIAAISILSEGGVEGLDLDDD